MAETKIIAALVVAAGRGERASGSVNIIPKQYRLVAGRAVLVRAIDAMLAATGVALVLPVIARGHEDLYAALGIADARVMTPVHGGPSRQASVLAGLEALLPSAPDIVLIHDAARPFVGTGLIEQVIAAIGERGGAIPVLPVTDTIKRSEDGVVVAGTENRSRLYAAQTPQGFRFSEILKLHRAAAASGLAFTDDAAIAEWAGVQVRLTPGSRDNAKLTTQEDFDLAEIGMSARRMESRIGTGFDVHPFTAGDHVWLGGVSIPHSRGLQGHSDADAALHALADAIYGALGEGDIGTHFPPSDSRWRGAASSTFLAHAADLVARRGGRIVNLDLTLVCEAPRISPHVQAMRQVIAGACNISPSRIAIKATTSERLGFTGREEGIAAMASASVELPYEGEYVS